jgi:D-alanine-D-alanine ligase
MAKKIRVGVLFGGRSGEHEVSLLSAASVVEAIDKTKYEVVPIGITKDGRWLTSDHAERLLRGEHKVEKHLRAGDPDFTPGAAVLAKGESVIVPPVPGIELQPFETNLPHRRASDRAINVDVIFPVLHGTFGEDGTIQGLLELADIPYVGAGVLGSAAGMDKDVMKRLFRQAGLEMVKHVTVLRSQWETDPKKVRQGVGGKSGRAREIERAVLGNDQPQASVAGEVVPAAEFYDYNAKYIDEGSKLHIPAKLTRAQQKKVQEMAVKAFLAVDCSGLARVDFLMDPKSGRIFVNEINTMPGFTSISMYPKLWAASGISYPELISRLIQLGLQRFEEKKRNKYTKD